MSSDQRFITFKDLNGGSHTYRITDIQAVGMDNEGSLQNYVRAFDFSLIVPLREAVRVREIWIKEG